MVSQNLANYGMIRDDIPFKEFRPRPCHDCGHFPLIYTQPTWGSCLDGWNRNMVSIIGEREAVNG